MANAIGLSMQISASTSSLAQSLSEADRLIAKLGQGAVSAGKEFESFRDASGNLPAAMQSIVDQAGFLAEAFRGGAASAAEFKEGIAEVAEGAAEITALFQAGSATTARYATEEERASQALAAIEAQYAANAISIETYTRAKNDLTGVTAAAAQADRDAAASSAAAEAAASKAAAEAAATTAKYATEAEKKAAALARVESQYAANLISEETYRRAVDDLTGATTEANKAEQEAAALKTRAAAITAQVATPTEKYAQTVGELDGLLNRGLISQETYNRALEQARANLDKAAASADAFGKKSSDAADKGLKFNEISGVFGLLPGPLGAAASRISSVASASEGLGKIFSGGGLGGAVENLSQAFAFLSNPVGQAAAALIAAGAAATAVISNLSSLANEVEKLGNISIKTGASFDFLQVLGEAAVRSGSSVDAAGMSLTRLSRAIDDARNGGKKSAETFARIGLSAEDLAKMTPEEVFKKMAAELQNIEDPAARAGIAMDLLGRSGAEILPTIMNLGASEKDMQRFLATLSQFDKIRLEQVDAAFESLSTAGKGLTNSLTLPFAGLVSSITDGLAELVGGITAIVRPIGQVLEPLLTGFGRIAEVIGMGLGTIGRVIGAALAPLGELASTFSKLFDPLYEGLIATLGYVQDFTVGVVEFVASWGPVALINDLVQALSGYISSLASTASAAFESVMEVVGRVGAIFQAVFGKISEFIGDAISDVVSSIGSLIQGFLDFTGVGEAVSAVASAIGNSFSSAWNIIKGVISTIGGLIDQVLTFAEDWLGIKRDVEEPVKAAVELDVNADPATATATVFYDELDKATKKAAEFGEEGTNAALRYQSALDEINQLMAEGEYTEEQKKRAVAQATAEFEKQIDVLKEAKKAQEEATKEAEKAAKAAEDAAQRQADAYKRVADEALKAQELQSKYGGNKEQQKAAEDLVAITQEIARVEAEIIALREKGDQAGADAAAARLAALDQVKQGVAETAEFGFNQADVDKAIADVSKKIDEGISQYDVDLDPEAADAFFDKMEVLKQQLNDKLIDPKEFEEAAAAAQKQFQKIADVTDKVFGSFSEADFEIAPDAADELKARMEQLKEDFSNGLIDEKQFEKAAESFKKSFDAAKKQAEDIIKLEEKYAEEAGKIEEERVKELSKTSSKSVKANDVRTSEGASELLRFVTGQQDPAIEEYRKQTAKLDEIRKEIAKTAAKPVEILS